MCLLILYERRVTTAIFPYILLYFHIYAIVIRGSSEINESEYRKP